MGVRASLLTVGLLLCIIPYGTGGSAKGEGRTRRAEKGTEGLPALGAVPKVQRIGGHKKLALRDLVRGGVVVNGNHTFRVVGFPEKRDGSGKLHHVKTPASKRVQFKIDRRKRQALKERPKGDRPRMGKDGSGPSSVMFAPLPGELPPEVPPHANCRVRSLAPCIGPRPMMWGVVLPACVVSLNQRARM